MPDQCNFLNFLSLFSYSLPFFLDIDWSELLHNYEHFLLNPYIHEFDSKSKCYGFLNLNHDIDDIWVFFIYLCSKSNIIITTKFMNSRSIHKLIVSSIQHISQIINKFVSENLPFVETYLRMNTCQLEIFKHIFIQYKNKIKTQRLI